MRILSVCDCSYCASIFSESPSSKNCNYTFPSKIARLLYTLVMSPQMRSSKQYIHTYCQVYIEPFYSSPRSLVWAPCALTLAFVSHFPHLSDKCWGELGDNLTRCMTGLHGCRCKCQHRFIILMSISTWNARSLLGMFQWRFNTYICGWIYVCVLFFVQVSLSCALHMYICVQGDRWQSGLSGVYVCRIGCQTYCDVPCTWGFGILFVALNRKGGVKLSGVGNVRSHFL